MTMHFRRQNTLWLAALGALVLAAGVAGIAEPPIFAALVALYAVALAASLIEFQPRRLRDAIPSSPLTRMRMSPQAREATERARRRSSYTPSGLMLLDVGLISLITSSDGSMIMRRGRQSSLDDNGVRPYITLNVEPNDADRNALIRFEIIDHNGQTQYVHEMKTFLRDGEMNILADTQLPLYGNDRLAGAGDWDLRVSIDGMTLGLLSFSMTPSVSGRSRQVARRAEAAAIHLEDTIDDSSPVSLEDLLRTNQNQRGQER
ncbi:MAG: hypothetical protein R3E39_13510 [Anaerolineae bacterium]